MITLSIWMYIFIILGIFISAFTCGYEFRRIHSDRKNNA